MRLSREEGGKRREERLGKDCSRILTSLPSLLFSLSSFLFPLSLPPKEAERG
jgi:hypothetical protein